MSKKKIVYLYPDQLHEKEQELIKSEVYFVDSTSTLYVPKENTTYVNVNACREWPNADGEVVLMTPGQAVRAEIERFYPDTNFRARKSDFRLLDISPPMYWEGVPIYYERIYYYDIKHAYAQLYQRLTLDIKYPRGQGEMPLLPIARRLDDWREARNSLVGVTRSYTITGVLGAKKKEVHFHNPVFNPALWATIQSLLHEIAIYAIKCGSFYIGTDCYMFRRKTGSNRFREFCERLELSTHYGEGGEYSEVTGWGSYKIEGYKETKRRAITITPLNNITKTDGRFLEWWKKQKPE